MLQRVVEQLLAVDETINFEKCCRPVLMAMNIFGIPLRMKNDPSTWSLWAVYIYGWILYCINVASGLIFISIEKGNRSNFLLSNRTTAWQLNLGITTYNNVFSVMATHTVLLSITAVRWKDMAHVFHRMERIDQFGLKEFQTFRTIFRSGLFLATVGYLAVGVYFISAYFMSDMKIWQMALYSFHRGFLMVIVLAAILFVCFGCMASTMLQMLGKEMSQQSAGNMDALITKWTRHYFMTIDFVHKFNRCFGSLLLVFIAPIFIRVISNSFILMIELKDGRWTMTATINLVVLLVNFLGFILTAHIPHRIRQEAIDLTKKLRRFQLKDFSQQNQVNVLIMEISNSLPRITAAGFFDVDLQLIPTLIGTTLTYLIILFQFQTSEKT